MNDGLIDAPGVTDAELDAIDRYAEEELNHHAPRGGFTLWETVMAATAEVRRLRPDGR